MHTHYSGTILTGAVVYLWVVMKVDSGVIKPVVPMCCQRLCGETTGCFSFIYMASDLSCHLLTKKSLTHSLKEIERVYGGKNMMCPNDIKLNYSIGNTSLRSYPFKKIYKGPKKERNACNSDVCKLENVRDEDAASRCILHTRENLSDIVSENINLTSKVKTGMKFVVHGARMKTLRDSQLTITKDPNTPANPMKWFHIRALWNERAIWFTDRVWKQSSYKKKFPISDPSNFTIAVELTPLSTKIYANKVLVKSMNPIPEINEIYLRRFSKVYHLVVQKAGEGCDEVDNGIPRSLQYP